MATTLQAGVAKVDITPPLTIPYLGYEPRHAFFQGVHDRLYARALAVNDGETRIVLITSDAIGYNNKILGPGRDFTREVRERIQARTGVPAGNIMLASSHAHSTPETINFRPLRDHSGCAAWLEVLIDQLVSAAAMAVSRQRQCTLKIGTGSVSNLAANRRILGKDGKLYSPHRRPADIGVVDWGATDPQVNVCLFESVDDGTCIVLTNFACHPITMQVQPLVSADFPGVAMDLVERTVTGCTGSLFVQGACGDQNPVRGDTRDFDDVQHYGQMLGGEVLKLVNMMRAPDYRASQPHLAVAAADVSLPAREAPPRSSVMAAYEAASRKLVQATTQAEREQLTRERRMAEEMLVVIDWGTEPLPAEVQVFRVGDAALIGLPGEPFVELGLEIKHRAAVPFPFVVGYANNYLGYFATPSAWELGGYEVSYGPWAPAGPESSALLVEKAVELTAWLWTGRSTVDD